MHRQIMAISGTARLFVMAVAIAIMPGIAHALGLGNLKVYSALNERLSAEIEFTPISNKQLRTLTAGVGSQADFAAAGLERLPFLSDVKVTVARGSDGDHSLRLSSRQPLSDPILRFLVRVDWAGGHLVQEFTAIIDPISRVVDDPIGKQALDTTPRGQPAPTSETKTARQPSAGQRPAIVAGPIPKPTLQRVDKPRRPLVALPRRVAWDAITEIIRDRTGQALMAVVTLLAALIFVVYARWRTPRTRPEKDMRSAEDSVSAGGEIIDGDQQAPLGADEDRFVFSDFSQDGMGNISADEVDAVDGTDAIMALGRDADDTADTLKDAIAKNPERHDLKFKLLEFYREHNDVAAYKALIEELSAATETGEPVEDEELTLPDNKQVSLYDTVGLDVDEPNHENDVAETEPPTRDAGAPAGEEKANESVIEMAEAAGAGEVIERETQALEIAPPIDEQVLATVGTETSESDEPANDKKVAEQGMGSAEADVPDKEKEIARALAALETNLKTVDMTVATGDEEAGESTSGPVAEPANNKDIDDIGHWDDPEPR